MRRILALLTAITFIGNVSLYAGTTAFATGDRGSGAYEVYIITDEGLKVGNGTPTTTMNGEDAYVEGTFEVDGAVGLDGSVTVGDDLTVTDNINVGTTARVIDAGTYSIRISTHVDVTGNIDVSSTLTVDTIDDSGGSAIAISSHVNVTGNVDLSGTLTVDTIDDSGAAAIAISSHVAVTGNVTLTGDATVSGGDIDLGNTGRKISDDSTNYGLKLSTMVNMQAYPITNVGSNNTDFESDGTLVSGSGKLGYYGADTNKYYHVLISTELADAEEYTLVSDAKAGAFEVHMGTFSAFGTHTTAAAVTLTTSSSANTSTTNNNAATLNVYDGGTSVIVENKSGSTLQTWIEYWWQN